jgi:hypothetical protein
MRILRLTATIVIAAATALSALGAAAQNTANLNVLRGLAPVTVLDQTNAGRAALAGNYARTGAIQHGAADQPILLPFAIQQQQALRDAFITDPNGSDLADGLGTSLGGAYQSLTGCTSNDDGKNANCPNISDAIARLELEGSCPAGLAARAGAALPVLGRGRGNGVLGEVDRTNS